MKKILVIVIACCQLHVMAQYTVIKKLDNKTITTAQIDETVNRLMMAGKVTGLGLAILNNNKPVYEKTYGFKNHEDHSLLDTATVVYGASFSKAVFAFVSMTLVQDGILDLDKPLSLMMKKPLTDYPRYTALALDERWKTITPRMCLSHTTGLPNLWFMNPITSAYDNTAANMHLYFAPGSRYAYSGEGIKLLQIVLEELTGRNLQQIAEEKLFIPAGMKRTSYIWNHSFDDNSAEGHDEQGKPSGKKEAGKPGAAGSMVTTIADYSRFISYIMEGKGLQPKYRDMMISPQVAIHSKFQFPPVSDDSTTENENIHLSYGLGWGVIKTMYGPAFFKEGHDDYWRNYNINFPDRKTAIIIMSNSANGESIFKELLQTLIGDRFTPWSWERYIPYDKQ
jgi:CubicO group peptidase (beta-lactamase class C family)